MTSSWQTGKAAAEGGGYVVPAQRGLAGASRGLDASAPIWTPSPKKPNHHALHGQGAAVQWSSNSDHHHHQQRAFSAEAYRPAGPHQVGHGSTFPFQQQAGSWGVGPASPHQHQHHHLQNQNQTHYHHHYQSHHRGLAMHPSHPAASSSPLGSSPLGSSPLGSSPSSPGTGVFFPSSLTSGSSSTRRNSRSNRGGGGGSTSDPSERAAAGGGAFSLPDELF